MPVGKNAKNVEKSFVWCKKPQKLFFPYKVPTLTLYLNRWNFKILASRQKQICSLNIVAVNLDLCNLLHLNEQKSRCWKIIALNWRFSHFSAYKNVFHSPCFYLSLGQMVPAISWFSLHHIRTVSSWNIREIDIHTGAFSYIFFLRNINWFSQNKLW